MTYTPGPWYVGEVRHNYDCIIRGKDADPICSTYYAGYTKRTAQANAALIAAAPNLLKALQKAVKDYGKLGGPWNVPSEPGTWIHMAQTAIANATGNEPPKDNGVV